MFHGIRFRREDARQGVEPRCGATMAAGKKLMVAASREGHESPENTNFAQDAAPGLTTKVSAVVSPGTHADPSSPQGPAALRCGGTACITLFMLMEMVRHRSEATKPYRLVCCNGWLQHAGSRQLKEPQRCRTERLIRVRTPANETLDGRM